MENGADALLIAFAVLIFIIALSVSLVTLAQAKSTADVVLFYSDRENFQIPLKDDPENIENGGRTVGIDTVIATLYKCKRENFAVNIDGENFDNYTNEEMDRKIAEFIESSNSSDKYRETYVEVNTGGTIIEENGEALEQNTWKKMYITYKHIGRE